MGAGEHTGTGVCLHTPLQSEDRPCFSYFSVTKNKQTKQNRTKQNAMTKGNLKRKGLFSFLFQKDRVHYGEEGIDRQRKMETEAGAG